MSSSATPRARGICREEEGGTNRRLSKVLPAQCVECAHVTGVRDGCRDRGPAVDLWLAHPVRGVHYHLPGQCSAVVGCDLGDGVPRHREHHHIGGGERLADWHHRCPAWPVPRTSAGAENHVVPSRPPPCAERAADLTGTDNSDLHSSSLGDCSYAECLLMCRGARCRCSRG